MNVRPNWFSLARRKFFVRTCHGFSIWCDRRDVIGAAIIGTGQWEGLLSRTIAACLSPGDTAIDIGANIGYDTMLMSGAVGGTGRVFAFEPEVGILALLLENLAKLPHGNVIVQSLGLSDSLSIASISRPDESNIGSANLRSSNRGRPSQPLVVNRLDRLVPLDDEARIAMVKIDIEGFEHHAILGMGNVLDRVDVLTCEVDENYLNECGTTGAALFETLRSNGFDSYCAQPNSVGLWRRSNADFKIEVKESSHFDALFCRRTTPELEKLIENAA